jgi:hypothetical protein
MNITKEKVTQFLTQKVAKIIYDTVECLIESRADLDWQEAEKIVQNHLQWMIGRFVGEPVIGDTLKFRDSDPDPSLEFKNKFFASYILNNEIIYDEFENKFGEFIWHNTQYLRKYLTRPPYGKITFS